MNEVTLMLHKINKNLEKSIKLQKQQNELLQKLIEKQPIVYPTVTPTETNSDWLSPPPGYVGDWVPVRKQ